jgi:hypothetical protein
LLSNESENDITVIVLPADTQQRVEVLLERRLLCVLSKYREIFDLPEHYPATATTSDQSGLSYSRNDYSQELLYRLNGM